MGGTLDFVVGTNGQLFGDETRFNAIITLVEVPEPATAALLGLAGLVTLRRRKRAASAA